MLELPSLRFRGGYTPTAAQDLAEGLRPLKLEIRNSKSETSSQFRNHITVMRFDHSNLPFRICFEFRISNFGFHSQP
jgi:hypothetical protein